MLIFFIWPASGQQPINKLPALSEANYAQGYEVQKAFVVASGQSLKTVTGWKAAMGTRAAMQRFQISEPIYGALFSDMAVTEGVAKSENFIAPKLEAEVAFILKQDLCGDSLSNAAIVEAIGFIAPAFEIADCRIEGWTFDIPHFIADNAVAAGYQLGSPIEFTGPEQLTDLTCTLSFADQTLLGSADAVLGGPMASFIKMVRGILEIHGELYAGQLFLSGSLTKPIDMQAGTEYRLNLFEQELKLAYQ